MPEVEITTDEGVYRLDVPANHPSRGGVLPSAGPANPRSRAGTWVCRTCKKHPGPDEKFMHCSRCKSDVYCGKACFKAGWNEHKARCKRQVEDNAYMAGRKGRGMSAVDPSRRCLKKAIGWFNSYDEWVNEAICLGWKHRAEKAWIVCVGQRNAKETPDFEVLTGDDRARGRYGGFADRCLEQESADPDKHFFVILETRHPGSEEWPLVMPRMLFPCSPEEMDGWVEDWRRIQASN